MLAVQGGIHMNPQHVKMQHWPGGHSLSWPLGQHDDTQAQNCTKNRQMHPDPRTQQLQVPSGPQGMAMLQGLFTSQPQLSLRSQPAGEPWANAGVLMLVTIGAVQAKAAPAPIRFNIFRREIPDVSF